MQWSPLLAIYAALFSATACWLLWRAVNNWRSSGNPFCSATPRPQRVAGHPSVVESAGGSKKPARDEKRGPPLVRGPLSNCVRCGVTYFATVPFDLTMTRLCPECSTGVECRQWKFRNGNIILYGYFVDATGEDDTATVVLVTFRTGVVYREYLRNLSRSDQDYVKRNWQEARRKAEGTAERYAATLNRSAELPSSSTSARSTRRNSPVHGHYATMGLEDNSPINIVEKAYRDLSLRHHPDRNPDDPEAQRKQKALNEAYDRIKDYLSTRRATSPS
jgi:hypothetical protein